MQHYNMIESRSLSNNMFDLIYNTNNGGTSALNLGGLLVSQVSYQMTSMIACPFYYAGFRGENNDLPRRRRSR